MTKLVEKQKGLFMNIKEKMKNRLNQNYRKVIGKII